MTWLLALNCVKHEDSPLWSGETTLELEFVRHAMLWKLWGVGHKQSHTFFATGNLGVFCVSMGSSPVMTRDYQPWVSMDAEIYQGTWMNHVYPMQWTSQNISATRIRTRRQGFWHMLAQYSRSITIVFQYLINLIKINSYLYIYIIIIYIYIYPYNIYIYIHAPLGNLTVCYDAKWALK